MKKIILASILLLSGLISFSQGTRTEKKTITENGVTKSWIITKQFDAQGNLIDYDSTYTENVAPQQFDNNYNDWPLENQDLFANPHVNMADMDSIFSQMQLNMSQLMDQMNIMMENMQSDSLFQQFQFSPDFEFPEQEQFQFPEGQNGNSKGTRI